MPPARSCECGTCPTCKKREAQTRWYTRARRGGATASEKSEAARQSIMARWGNRTPVEADYDDGVSDAELDRRALAKWRPEWNA